jgi:hypothetical protein
MRKAAISSIKYVCMYYSDSYQVDFLKSCNFITIFLHATSFKKIGQKSKYVSEKGLCIFKIVHLILYNSKCVPRVVRAAAKETFFVDEIIISERSELRPKKRLSSNHAAPSTGHFLLCRSSNDVPALSTIKVLPLAISL